MNGRIIFLLEEPSMKELLDRLLPRLFRGWGAGTHFLCIPHAGKHDLEKSIPRKLRVWREPGARFVVVRDNDSGDCLDLKRKLSGLCERAGRPDTLIRLVCQELEAWYIGDLESLADAYGKPALRRPPIVKRFADPDSVVSPSRRMSELLPSFQKVSGARLMGMRLSAEGNRSKSFSVFVEGVRRLSLDMTG